MCDTMVALGNATKDGSVIFAKNSDRDPNEPLLTIRIPAGEKSGSGKVKCTYMEVEQAKYTHEVLLLKPSWMWGAEMGINEYGLSIGNEAVFTREKYGKDALIGMDMLRIALERCKNAEEALEMIIWLLQKYGQGGNCGYKKKFTYHNSFLIADGNNCFVLETSGKYWIYDRVRDIYCISNRLTIGKTYEKCHPELIDNALKRGFMKKGEDFDFARHYQDPLITRLSGSFHRLSACRDTLSSKKGAIDEETMKQVLRSHDKSLDKNPFSTHSLKSVCAHGGFLFGDHTTGSFISSVGKEGIGCLLTGASTPCLSIFKPFSFVESENLTFGEEDANGALAYWLKRETLHRMVIENRISDLDGYMEKRNDLEGKISGKKVFDRNFINDYLFMEEELVDKTIEKNLHNRGKMTGNPYFNYYWRKKTKNLLIP